MSLANFLKVEIGLVVCLAASILSYEIRTHEPVTWNQWLVSSSRARRLFSLDLAPVLETEQRSRLVRRFPEIGAIGLLTTLATERGIICSDWKTVVTGSPWEVS